MSTSSVTTGPPIPPGTSDGEPPGGHSPEERKRRFLYLIVIPLVVGIVLLAGSPWWWKAIFGSGSASSSGIAGFNGGCPTFHVYSENRWAPVGTAIRAQPSVLSTEEGSYSPNTRDCGQWMGPRSDRLSDKRSAVQQQHLVPSFERSRLGVLPWSPSQANHIRPDGVGFWWPPSSHSCEMRRNCHVDLGRLAS